MDKYVINLSKYTLTKGEISVLSRGLNFCPTPGEPNPGELRTDLDNLHRRLRLRYHFQDDDSDDGPTPHCDNIHSTEPFANRKFKVSSSFNPPGQQALAAMVLTNEHDLNQRPVYKRAPRENISLEEKKAISTLKNNGEIIIKPADKGSAVVVMDRCDYLKEGYKQLSNTKFYQKLEFNPTDGFRKEIYSYIDSMYAKGEIDISVHNYLYNKECRTSVFNFYPKYIKGLTQPPGDPYYQPMGAQQKRYPNLWIIS